MQLAGFHITNLSRDHTIALKHLKTGQCLAARSPHILQVLLFFTCFSSGQPYLDDSGRIWQVSSYEPHRINMETW